jgi:hypothetical protein
MRRFILQREIDETGISGTGIIAEGVVFDEKGRPGEGKVVLHWCTSESSIVIYENLNGVTKVHCHNGNTKIIWIDCCKTCSNLQWYDDKGGQCWGTSCPMYYEDSCPAHQSSIHPEIIVKTVMES